MTSMMTGSFSQFRERLAAEVRAQTGQEFAIFQDRNDIAWGQNWQQRIDEALDAVTLLLVIITPSLFRSPPCRAEVDQVPGPGACPGPGGPDLAGVLHQRPRDG